MKLRAVKDVVNKIKNKILNDDSVTIIDLAEFAIEPAVSITDYYKTIYPLKGKNWQGQINRNNLEIILDNIYSEYITINLDNKFVIKIPYTKMIVLKNLPKDYLNTDIETKLIITGTDN